MGFLLGAWAEEEEEDRPQILLAALQGLRWIMDSSAWRFRNPADRNSSEWMTIQGLAHLALFIQDLYVWVMSDGFTWLKGYLQEYLWFHDENPERLTVLRAASSSKFFNATVNFLLLILKGEIARLIAVLDIVLVLFLLSPQRVLCPFCNCLLISVLKRILKTHPTKHPILIILHKYILHVVSRRF